MIKQSLWSAEGQFILHVLSWCTVPAEPADLHFGMMLWQGQNLAKARLSRQHVPGQLLLLAPAPKARGLCPRDWVRQGGGDARAANALRLCHLHAGFVLEIWTRCEEKPLCWWQLKVSILSRAYIHCNTLGREASPESSHRLHLLVCSWAAS